MGDAMRWHNLTFLLMFPCLAVPAQADPVENQAAYLARCRTETMAAYPTPRAQADSICQSSWEAIVASGPMADTLLGAAPPAGGKFDPAAAKAKAAAARLGDVTAQVSPSGIALSWFKDGEPIPFNLVQALKVRGTPPAMIACLAFGAGESTEVYRVSPAGKAPFVLTIAQRSAAVASQSSIFSASADFSGKPVTLATLAKDGNDWAARCPQ
jgi:hypothetical protein